MTALDRLRELTARRAHPGLPLLDGRAVLVGALTTVTLYLLLTAWLLPGVIDVLAALPVGARLGVLLLTSTATRFVGGWFSARRYRTEHGLPGRASAVPSAALGGLAGYLAVALLGALVGAEVSGWSVLLDAVRWPLECVVGSLIALPGTPTARPAPRLRQPVAERRWR